MAFDIYGEKLERGHCEVHSWVGEEYPCSLCYAESEKIEHNKQQEKEYNEHMEKAYYHSMYMEYSEEYRILHGREEKIKKLLMAVMLKKEEAIQKIPF